MTLRANVTSTYQEVNVNPPRATKNLRKKEADLGVHESERTRNPLKPASKTPIRGGVPLTEQKRNQSAERNCDSTSATIDVFKHITLEDKSKIADRNGDMQSGSMVKKAASSEPTTIDESYEASGDGQPKTSESLSQSLPVALPPKIRHSTPSKEASDNPVVSGGPLDPVSKQPDEDTMQGVLMAALQFGQTSQADLPNGWATGGDVAKHLQSEGVFGISSNGRNLGAVDFIRQKQFEYSIDQKSFTTDALLLEAEKAIHGTLNSDQSSSVSKSLLRAAESINAYRNQSVKSSEQADVAAKPVRMAKSTGKENA